MRRYDELREEHYASLSERKFLTLEKARSKAPVIDWKIEAPPVPKMLGNKVSVILCKSGSPPLNWTGAAVGPGL